MNISLLSDYSLWWIPLIIAFSALITWFLYFKKPQNDLSVLRRWLLALLRFFSFLLIGFLLLKPVVRTIKKDINKPIVFFIQDNSSSIQLASDSLLINNVYPQKVKELLKKLGKNYNVEKLSFGDTVSNNLSFTFNESTSDFSSVFSLFSTQYYNQNIGAIILATDGIYNQGTNPEILAQRINAPIYTIPLGDSVQPKDIRISKIKYNKKVFKGSNTPIYVSVMAKGLSNQTTVIRLIHNNKVIESQLIAIDDKNYFTKVFFSINADKAGLQQYTIQIDAIEDESLTENNKALLLFEVEDKKKEILFLQNGWHPDAKAFNMALVNNPAYSMQVVNANENLDTLNIDRFALVILHQLPSIENSIPSVIKKLNKLNKPVLFILGEQLSVKAFNQLNVGIKISNFKGSFDNTNPILNEKFTLFKFNDDNNITAQFPPLTVPFGDLPQVAAGNILFYQGLGNLNTQKPLIFFPETGGLKTGIIFGEGIWRWQLSEYAISKSHTLSNQLIFKTVQYLISEANKERFVVEVPTLNDQGQLIRVNARLYNASYELIMEPEVKFDLFNEDGEYFPYFFDKMNAEYQLNIKGLDQGKYTYSASAQHGNQTFIKKGSFIVKHRELERQYLVANYSLLNKISANSGGKMFAVNNIADIELAIDNNESIYSKSYSVKSMQDLTDRKLFYFIIVLLLTVEWFLRKLWGTR